MRRPGVMEVFAENSGIEVLAKEYTGWSRDEGKTIMENWLQAYDQIDAVVADSGIQQQGAYEAVSEAGRLDEVKVWTGDSLRVGSSDRQRIDPGVSSTDHSASALSPSTLIAILSGIRSRGGTTRSRHSAQA
jgi:ABC-type sugar transport system substrate-binding protein